MTSVGEMLAAPLWQALDHPVILADCLDVLRALPEASVDAIVTDPPYGLSREPDAAEMLRHWLAGDDYEHRGGGFAGLSWDSFVPGPIVWREALRVLRPGGYLLAFGGTRTYDLLVLAVRLAGFEIRDTIMWLHGSGFPKSVDVSKAIDRAAGAERPIVAKVRTYSHFGRTKHFVRSDTGERSGPDHGGMLSITAPATPEAAAWEGWGTALKPACEPVVVARKPLVGPVAENVLRYGTGGLNIDACRIPTTDSLGGGATLDQQAPKPDGWDRPWRHDAEAQAAHAARARANVAKAEALGRWPANVLLDEDAAAALDAQTGELRSGFMPAGTARAGLGYRGALGETVRNDTYGDAGGASRFFYVSKVSPSERNAGLDGCDAALNIHPTVKPIALMRWLLRLVTPPGGLVLDPFAGSGTTVCAGAVEGITVVGIERDPTYAAIARARAAWWAEHPDGVEVEDRLAAERRRRRAAEDGQLDIMSALQEAA